MTEKSHTEADSGQVYWRSRRGLLELDLILIPFTNNHYFRLPKNQQNLYKRMLDLDDVVILDWLQGMVDVPLEYQSLVEEIRVSSVEQFTPN